MLNVKSNLSLDRKRTVRFVLSFSIVTLFQVITILKAQPLSLRDAVRTALQNNQTILYNAEQTLLSARAQLNASEASYNPTVFARLHLSRSLSSNQILTPQKEPLYQTYQSQQMYPDVSIQQKLLTPLGGSLTLSSGVQTLATGLSSFAYQTRPTIGLFYQQPLSPAGIASGHADIEQARFSVQQAEMNYQLQKEQLALAVIQSYFQLWQAVRNVEQSLSDVESAQRILDIAELKLKNGNIAEFEVLNLRVQLRLTEDNLLQVRNQYRTQTIVFLRLLGASMDTSVTLSQHVEIDSLMFSLEEAITRALTNRLELKQARISSALARLNRDITASAFSPSLQLNGTYSLNSNIETTFLRSLTMPNYGWSLFATLSLPLLDGGRTSSLLESAERNIAILEKNTILFQEEIALEIETRYRTLQLNSRRLASLQLSLDAAAEALRIAEVRFQSGDLSSTEIENIRNRYNTTRRSLDGAKVSYMIERAGLAKAMGELLSWIESLENHP